MRKQYHFWPAADGDRWDAWDVHRLIELARALPREDVPLTQIHELDTDYWSQAGTEPTVRGLLIHVRLILDVDPSHPILLGPDGRVMDGMHRVCRAILDNHATITAVRFPHLPEPDHRNVRPHDLSYDNPPW